jgi:hypothetical protein
MSYFIFDMDETLAELYSAYYFVASLRLKETYEEYSPNLAPYLSTDLLKNLKKSYRLFIKYVLNVEKSEFPLGILRPGILDVMTKLHDLQMRGVIKNVLIYSNNGHLQSLEFIRDLIHEHVGNNNLIKECIHWNHHMRDSERTTQPGAANKTWNVLKNIMVNGNCKAPSNLEPSQVFFFDDLNHKDLQENLGQNYYKVPAYNFRASFERIAQLYKNAIYEGNVNIPQFSDLVFEVFIEQSRVYYIYDYEILDDLLHMFREKTKGTAEIDVLPPPEDSGIEMMYTAISRLPVKGGKRRRVYTVKRKRKRSQTSKKN